MLHTRMRHVTHVDESCHRRESFMSHVYMSHVTRMHESCMHDFCHTYRRVQSDMLATHCNTLQHTATHCNTLQRTATHCNTRTSCACHDLPCTHGHPYVRVAVCCSVLQCVLHIWAPIRAT